MKATVTDLAWWAEAAHGQRNEPLALVELEVNGQKQMEVMKRADVRPDQRVVLEIEPREDHKVEPAAVTIVAPGGKTEDATHCDALFWTRSSFFKFLFPYYAAQRLFTWDQLMDMVKALMDDKLLAGGHIPPSRTEYFPKGSKDPARSIALLEAGEEGGENRLVWTTLWEYLRR